MDEEPHRMRLPPEILSHIFGQCTDATLVPELDKDEEETYWAPYPAWSQVCSVWRAIGLSTPSLWCNLHTFRSDSQIVNYLERSGQAALSVKIDCEHHQYNDPTDGRTRTIWQYILGDHGSRIERLTIRGDEVDLQDLFSSTRVLPMLQHLTLDAGDPDLLDACIIAPDSICRIIAPKLRRLHTYYTFVRWTSPLLQHATQLRSLVLNGDFPENSSSTEHVLAALRVLTCLKEVAMDGRCVSSSSQRDITLTRRCCLPELESLRIWGDLGDYELFLRKISIPITCRLSLIYLTERLHVNLDTIAALAAILRFHTPTGAQEPTRVAINHADPSFRPLHCRFDFSWGVGGQRNHVILDFDRVEPGDIVYIVGAMREYTSSLPLADVELAGHIQTPVREILETLSRGIPRVASLHLEGLDFAPRSLPLLLADVGLIEGQRSNIEKLTLQRCTNVSQSMIDETLHVVPSVSWLSFLPSQ